jgi:hypothetical protein
MDSMNFALRLSRGVLFGIALVLGSFAIFCFYWELHGRALCSRRDRFSGQRDGHRPGFRENGCGLIVWIAIRFLVAGELSLNKMRISPNGGGSSSAFERRS